MGSGLLLGHGNIMVFGYAALWIVAAGCALLAVCALVFSARAAKCFSAMSLFASGLSVAWQIMLGVLASTDFTEFIGDLGMKALYAVPAAVVSAVILAVTIRSSNTRRSGGPWL